MYGKINYLCPIISPDRLQTSLVGLKYSINTLFYTYIQNKGQPPTPPPPHPLPFPVVAP